MEQIIIAVAAKLAELAVESVVRSVGPAAKEYFHKSLYYSFYYSNIIGSMKKQADMLLLVRERVQHSIAAAIRNDEAIEGVVQQWLREVDKITTEAWKILEDEEETRIKGFNGTCLNLKLRYQLSQKAKKIALSIDKVLERSPQFDRVGYRLAPQGIVTTISMDYVDCESRKSIVKRLMEALRDDNIHVIGVWGMAGVGKTTLVREVAKQAKEKKLFDEVPIAIVTHSPDLRRIQGEIANMLGLKFDEETILGRARRLRERLSQDRKKPVILEDLLENLDLEERLKKTKDKKILVILDDIWENLDLEAIGIPYEECKVLLTSRNRDVLCSRIGTQKDFGLDVLVEEEAWSLFEKVAGDCVKDSILRCTAIEVAKECAGLPLALVTVSKALKHKSLYEWKDALQQLRKPDLEHLTKMQSYIYSSIGMSYKHLESKEARDLSLQISDINSQNSEQLKEVVEQANSNSQISKHLKEVAEQLKEVAATLKALDKGPIDVDYLYEEVMKMKVYDEVMLGIAFDQLVCDDRAARAFLAKNARLRKIWLEKFFNNHED